MENALFETWRLANRMNLYVLDAIAPDALADVSASKGRSVGAMFAHLHNVRLMWLEVAAPELMKGLSKIAKEDAHDKQLLRRSLAQSGDAVATMLEQGIAAGKIKGFKRSPAAFLGYLIAHDAYHQGEIGMTLKQAGHPLDKTIAYGMWEWGKL